MARHAALADPVLSATSYGFQLDQLVKQINPPKVRRIVGTVFGDLVRLLECLHPIEGKLDQAHEAEEIFALIQFIHDEARALVKFIEVDALSSKTLDKELCETLDAITFAVSHDLERVFENKVPGATDEPTSHVVVGKLFRAHDVLTNCLQQATISLATMFDPELVGTKLFRNSDMQYRQSVQLCGDLTTLLKLIAVHVEVVGEPAFANLTTGIEKFRSESIECLRYSDRPQFESFCERIQRAETATELEPVLHQFRCYLETLLGQVRMRAVLANVLPGEFEMNDVKELPSRDNNSMQFYAPADFQDDSVGRETIASAI